MRFWYLLGLPDSTVGKPLALPSYIPLLHSFELTSDASKKLLISEEMSNGPAVV